MTTITTSTGRTPAARWLAGLLVSLLPLLVIVQTYRWWRDRLPDPLPSHWNVSGQVDGTTSLSGMLTATVAIAGVGVLLAVVAVVGGRFIRWGTRRVLLCTGAGVAGLGASLWWLTASLALDVADAHQARPPTWHVLALLAGMVLPVVVAAVALGRGPAARPATGRPPEGAPRARLAAGQPAVWTEVHYPSAPSLVVVAVTLAVGVVMAILINPWAASPAALAALVVALALTIRLTVDDRGLHVGFGPWGRPRLTVPLAEIEYAEPTEVRPLEWGGWGYRMMPGGRAVVLRRGPGVHLALSEGRRFVVSTHDPEALAGLVNTLVDRSVR
ncbi:MAG TPA: DUF1648 domain-containing protein [Natronosporangium sp.]|nr:DUF1648 domain-containing protein [Natronosporangium sp.]